MVSCHLSHQNKLDCLPLGNIIAWVWGFEQTLTTESTLKVLYSGSMKKKTLKLILPQRRDKKFYKICPWLHDPLEPRKKFNFKNLVLK
jgi:hypothetical protein